MNRNKITRLSFIIVLVSFLLSTFASLWSLRLMARQNMEELSKAIAARIYDTISGELSEPTTVSVTMAHDQFLIDMLTYESRYRDGEVQIKLARYLSSLKDSLNYETAFVVSDASRYYYSYSSGSEPVKRISPETDDRDLWYPAFVNSGKAYDLDIDRDERNQDAWTVFVDARITDAAGNLLGVCGVGKQMDITRNLFTELEKQYGVQISLVDGTGLVKVDTDESAIENVTLDRIRLVRSDEYVYDRTDDTHAWVSKYIDRLGWYLVVQTDNRNERGQLLRIILFNAVLCAVAMIILLLAVRIIASRTKALATASLRDHPTGLLNRRAFEEDKAHLEEAGAGDDFVYAIADLNGLKAANDILGHSAGDEMIRGAAGCLREAFSSFGKIYRIGGDEFAMLLHMSPEQQSAAAARLDEILKNWTGEKIESLSISCGYASRREFPSENITELSRIADERMYAVKDEWYRQTGKPRRT